MSYSILDALKDIGRCDLKIVPTEVQKARVTICTSCPEYGAILHQCKACHCLVEGKSWLLKATCPKEKWV